MKVVILGATGNVGTSLLEALSDEPRVEEIVAVARREPVKAFPRNQVCPGGHRQLGSREHRPGG